MQTYDLKSRNIGKGRAEVFHLSRKDEFACRLLQLDNGEEIPPSGLDSYIIFVVITGKVKITADEEEKIMSEGECMISSPAVMAMQAQKNTRILGIKINLCQED